MSSENKKFNKDLENPDKDVNSSNNKYKIYKTKTDFLPYNSKYKTNPEVYITLDPEYLENNYKQEENFQNTNNKNYRVTPNTTKNNYANNNNFQRSPLNTRKLKEAQSPFGIDDNNLYYGSNTLDINNRETIYPDNFNNYENTSPFKKNKQRRSFGKNTFKDNIYVNKSIEYDKRKNNIDNNYITMTDPKNYNPKLMIYQKKMITIFVQILNKIMEKNKKKYIMTKFSNELKNKNEKPKYDENSHLYKRRGTKYNAYKNIMYVSAKTKNNSPKRGKYNISNNNNILINNMRKEKKDKINQRYNNTLKQKNKGNNKANMERLKELQKKYDKIYEKKKNDKTTSIDDKYKRYILRKNKTQDVFNITFDKPLNEEKSFKNKILKSRLNMDRTERPSSINLSHGYIPPLYKEKFIKIPRISDKEGKKYKIQKYNTPRNAKNKIIIIKKVRMTPQVATRKNTEIFKVYNIKDIVTPDKRLYVYINYITLSNKKKTKSYKYKYYDNNLLRISDRISINYINNNKSYKPKIKVIKYQIYLTKIKEEPFNSIDESENRKTKYLDQYDYLEKAISILERYKNKLKKKTIKNSIFNYGKDNNEKEE